MTDTDRKVKDFILTLPVSDQLKWKLAFNQATLEAGGGKGSGRKKGGKNKYPRCKTKGYIRADGGACVKRHSTPVCHRPQGSNRCRTSRYKPASTASCATKHPTQKAGNTSKTCSRKASASPRSIKSFFKKKKKRKGVS